MRKRLVDFFNKFMIFATALAYFSFGFAGNCYANVGSRYVKTNTNLMDSINGVLTAILNIANMVGIILAVVGLVQFTMAYKDDNADAMTRAVKTFGIAFVLIGIRTSLRLMGLIH